MKRRILPGLALLLLTAGALAQNPASQGKAQAPAAAAVVAGNPQAGSTIAQSGGQNGVTACVGCHGAQGEGNAAAGFPRLAGQPQAYLLRQLNAYANGRRDNPVMGPIAKAMQQQQMLDTSAWYASLGKAAGPAASAAGTPGAKTTSSTAANTGATAPAAVLARGKLLANVGSDSLQVQACVNCHGPNGAGEAPDYPSLAGQHASYLTAVMAEWKSGARKTDPSGQMPLIAQRLGDQDVAALAAYYAAQNTTPASAQEGNVAAGTLARPAVAAAAGSAGPSAAGANTATSGSGTEQGAPLTGGNQGPGGGGGTNVGKDTADKNNGGNRQSQPGAPAPAPAPAPPKKQQ
jgi:cytochrome c553